jgi:DNA helicase-2/ATP-dependent DNA helicase PcrA
MTRAKRQLLMTHAARRTVRGMRMSAMESEFLRELPEANVERTDLASSWMDGSGDGSGDGSDGIDEPWADEFDKPRGLGAQFPVGCMVRHPLFGTGTVQAILPRGSVTSARVSFRTVGVKTLVLEYAKLVRLQT